MKNTMFQKKKRFVKSGNVLHFCKSLVSALIEDSWILLSASAFKVILYHMTHSVGKTTIHTHENEDGKQCPAMIMKMILHLQTS